MQKDDFILQTKLTPPKIRKRILHRQRLLNLLEDNLDRKFILICADAGYGKTTLLAQLCAELDNPSIFYHIDPSDNDLATFFNYITAGIQQHYADFGQRAKEILGQTRNMEILVGTFINEFVEKIRREFHIVLDDYHHLQQNKEIGKALDYLLRHLPVNLHLIISSRSTPPLDLAYHSAKQELFRLENKHLQFSLKELQSLMEEVYGLNIPNTEIARIEKHSEGWITAIQLVLQKISASGEDKAKETLNGYVASGDEIFDYFARDVFESQPKEIREFLIKTSVLKYLNTKVCNYVLATKKSQKILSYLETEHIFVSRRKDNFEYHPLFQEFLHKMLDISHAGSQIRFLYRKAGRYFSKINDHYNAVSYFLLSANYDKAAKNLESTYYVLVSSGKLYTFLTLLDRLPRAILEKHPYLLLEKAKIFSFLGKWDEALRILSKTERIFKRQRNNQGLITTLDQIGFIYLVLMQPRRALQFEKKAYKLITPRNQILRAKILTSLGSINRALGKYTEAEDILKSALAISRRIKNTEIELRSLEGLARLYSEKTDFNAAKEVYAILLAKHGDKDRPFGFAGLCANAAALYIELFDFTRAEELINRAENLAHMFNDRRTLTYASGIRGKSYLYQNNYPKAIECYEETIMLNREPKEKLVDIYAKTDIIYAYVMTNEISRAKRELKKIETLISPHMPLPVLIDFCQIKGKIAMAERDFKSTEKNLCQALNIAEENRMLYRETAALFYLSQFYLKSDNERKAKNYIRRCFDIAQKNGYDFFLANEIKTNTKVFEYALNENINRDYVLTILETCDTPEAQRLYRKTSIEKVDYNLEVNLFGNLTIKDSNGMILNPKWKTRKAKSLFVYLIINQGRRILKDHIIEVFWPNKGPSKAIHSLHDHISFVRKALQEMLRKEYLAKNSIILKNQFYTLNNNINLKVDTQQFTELVKKADAMASVNRTRAATLYKMALDVYKGNFCPEIYEVWADEQRRHFCAGALRIAKKLGDFYYTNKDYPKSLHSYKNALEYDQCDETVHLDIMRCLCALGDKARVLRQYRELERILKQELDTSPSNETIRIYQELLQKSV